MSEHPQHTATYSPEDNKLRLYPACRLDTATYERVKRAGFIWAPKQELFVAPAWAPWREDLLTELCGEIGDEDKSLVERAEERAERFEDYSEKRAEEADRTHERVSEIAGGIPLGQPILVGHHSERRARRDAEKIRDGMSRAVKLWDTSKYWEQRAAGALRHAKYKELPRTRARRIKTIEADLRKRESQVKEAETFIKLWENKGEPITHAKARGISNYDHISREFKLTDYPREAPKSTYEGAMSLWSALGDTEDLGIITPQQAQEIALKTHRGVIPHYERWIAHYKNRLTYERAMLEESGGLISDKFDIQIGGQVLSRGKWHVVKKVIRKGGVRSVSCVGVCGAIQIEDVTDYRPPAEGDAEKVKAYTKLPPLCNYPGEGFKHMTEAEYKARRWSGYSYTEVVPVNEETKTGAHRVRRHNGSGMLGKMPRVYVTDLPTKLPPKFDGYKPEKPQVLPAEPRPVWVPRDKGPEAEKFEGMKESLRAGVQVVSANQLFPTPPAIARRLVELAEMYDGAKVLEPSAGTGNLLRALYDGPAIPGAVCALELNQGLWRQLQSGFGPKVDCLCGDFLECSPGSFDIGRPPQSPAKAAELLGLGKYDRVIMNPPFENGDDIKHILHATKFLKSDGLIAAICANGPRQQTQLRPLASTWMDLEPGAFAPSGTNVNAAIVIIKAANVIGGKGQG